MEPAWLSAGIWGSVIWKLYDPPSAKQFYSTSPLKREDYFSPPKKKKLHLAFYNGRRLNISISICFELLHFKTEKAVLFPNLISSQKN